MYKASQTFIVVLWLRLLQCNHQPFIVAALQPIYINLLHKKIAYFSKIQLELLILDNGNVGIGSVTPVYTFDVSSGSIYGSSVSGNTIGASSYVLSPAYRPLFFGNSIIFQSFSGTQISSIDNLGNLQTNGYVRAGNGTSAGIVDLWDFNSYKWRISTSGGFFTVLIHCFESPYIQMFQIQLCDEDGNPINLRGNDWSINVQFKFVPKQNLEFM